jgi:hypothetical protein
MKQLPIRRFRYLPDGAGTSVSFDSVEASLEDAKRRGDSAGHRSFIEHPDLYDHASVARYGAEAACEAGLGRPPSLPETRYDIAAPECWQLFIDAFHAAHPGFATWQREQEQDAMERRRSFENGGAR